MEIRRARPDDWRESRRIRLQALRDAPTAFASTYAREVAFVDEIWRQRIEASAQFLAFRDDGRDDVVVGTATGFVDPDQPADLLLVAMFVVPSARGRGVAAGLVDAVVDCGRTDLSVRRVVLHVVDTNLTARRLYERAGFVATGVTTALPHTPELTETEYALDVAGPPD